MDSAVECTHCQVTMTSWAAPGSPIRYFQCPFCLRTHSSLYGEVFRAHAGARVVGAPAREADPVALPMASSEEVRWAGIKARAARWFARLEADERRLGAREGGRPGRAATARPAAAGQGSAAAPALAAARPARHR